MPTASRPASRAASCAVAASVPPAASAVGPVPTSLPAGASTVGAPSGPPASLLEPVDAALHAKSQPPHAQAAAEATTHAREPLHMVLDLSISRHPRHHRRPLLPQELLSRGV